jgi:hypothetical protein
MRVSELVQRTRALIRSMVTVAFTSSLVDSHDPRQRADAHQHDAVRHVCAVLRQGRMREITATLHFTLLKHAVRTIVSHDHS